MADGEKRPVAVITGVGPGLGAALTRRFAQGYAVAIIARRAEYISSLAAEIRRSAGATILDVAADMGDAAQVATAFKRIRDQLGAPQVLIHNAGTSRWGSLLEVTPQDFEAAWRVNAFGAFLAAREVVPAMIEQGRGAILLTGATAGVKAGPLSAAFGPAKFALRGLAQSMARALGPKKIHVVWINVDGTIDIPGRTFAGLKREDMLQPGAIAETYWHLAHQDESAWSMELDVRPFKEKF